MTSIGHLAFANCSNLTTVHLRYNKVIDANIDTLQPFGDASNTTKINLYVPSGLVDLYRQNGYWNQRCIIHAISE